MKQNMIEQKGEQQIEWKKVGVGAGHCEVTHVDPCIIAQMPPPGSRTFIEVGPIEVVINEIKKFLRGEPNSLG